MMDKQIYRLIGKAVTLAAFVVSLLCLIYLGVNLERSCLEWRIVFVKAETL
jgi:hypothetical protein